MRTVARLDPQLNVAAREFRDKATYNFKDYVFLQPVDRVDFKPINCLWTSTYNPETGSEWVAWCKVEMPHWIRTPDGDPAPLFKLTQNVDLRIVEISTVEEALEFTVAYGVDLVKGSKLKAIRWDMVAADFDAIRLTLDHWSIISVRDVDQAMAITWLYSWDVESTAWFTWGFDTPELVTPNPKWFVNEQE